MIEINKVLTPWKEDYTIGMMYEDLKNDRRVFKYSGHGMIVIVNNRVLGSERKRDYVIQDGDVIKIIQPSGGG